MIRKTFVPAFVLAVTLTGLVGCPKKKDVAPAEPPPSRPAEPVTPPAQKEVPPDTFRDPKVESEPVGDPSIDQLNQTKPLRTVYFEYDSSDLDDASRAILQANADWLKKNPRRTIRIEGYCDERGSLKYNLALGERRANSLREYLESLGIAPSRMRILSYGEDRPAVEGHDDAAWRKNRRGEFWFES